MAGSTRLRHGNILHDILISKWYTMRAVAFIHWILLAIVKMGLRASLILSYPEIPQDRNSIPTHIRTYAYGKTAAQIGEMIPRLSIELTRCKDAPSVHMESCFIVPSLYGDSWEKTFDCTRFLFSLRNCMRALNSWVRKDRSIIFLNAQGHLPALCWVQEKNVWLPQFRRQGANKYLQFFPISFWRCGYRRGGLEF